jgi:ApaG protein
MAACLPQKAGSCWHIIHWFPDTMYSAITRAIRVEVEPIFLAEQSQPDEERYVWAYKVRIENQGSETVQLETRHWRITDALGMTREVKGEGVVGEQPVLAPGESFEYASGTPLDTPSGIMVGTYQMITGDGDRFEVDIPAFSLDSPYGRRMLN